MEKYRQRKMLKKAMKMLNTPARAPEVYTGDLTSLHVGSSVSSDPRTGSLSSSSPALTANSVTPTSPDETLRLAQARHVTEMMGDLCVRICRLQNGVGGADFASPTPEGGPVGEVEGLRSVVADLDLAFEELRRGLLLTDLEKQEQHARRLEELSSSTPSLSVLAAIKSAQLAEIDTKILTFYADLKQRKRSLWKVERTVRDLGVNVNDSRCLKLLKDQREAEAGIARTVDEGVRFFVSRFEVLRKQLFG